jgi:16S rRNA (cytosine967-C5)-methyltransferase
VSKLQIKADSLAFGLLAAARAQTRVRAGVALPQALSEIFASLPASSLTAARGAIQDIAYRTQRTRGRSDALLALLANKPPQPPVLQELLVSALSLLNEPDAPYEAFTIVDQAVNAATAHAPTAPAKGMVNAVLRRYLRERDSLLAQIDGQPEASWNYPAWWIEQTRIAYPETWQSILRAGNSAPPLTLRVNQRRISTEAYLERLTQVGLEATRIGPTAIRLARAQPVQQIPGFEQGLVSVQDAAAQLSAPLLDVQPGMRVLDACAAPGGKTGHLLETANIELLALDKDSSRLARVAENLKRLGLDATLRAGDASQADWWDGVPFDRILADVPCTASGIVRRHPDIRWLRREQDAQQLSALSAQILANLWQMLRPGGKLLLVTCSIWPQESALQADAFEQQQQAVRLPAPGQLLPSATAESDHDGLFHALFQKLPV